VGDTGRRLPIEHLSGLDFIEQTCWQEFLDSSMRLFAALESRLKVMHGLSMLDVLVLDLLSRGALRCSELAEAFMQPPSQVTLQVRQLKVKGLVGQWPTPHDPHGVLVNITAPGRARISAARMTYAREVRAHYLDRMSREEMITLTESHRRINTPPKAARSDAT
jgi:DNA-binding MarR family transcriptional regulator